MGRNIWKQVPEQPVKKVENNNQYDKKQTPWCYK